MIRIQDSGLIRHIFIGLPLNFDDAYNLSLALSEDYVSFSLEFGKIHTIGVEILNILHKEIYLHKKKISIITHTHRLNRYLHKLGFQTKLISLVKEYVVRASTIEVIIIGGSADSSSKIVEIVKNCNLNNLVLIIVQHVEMNKTGIFDEILRNYTNQVVKYAQDKEEIKKGCIYIARNSKHLKVKDGYFYLSDDAKYNFSKPSISVSYESFSNYYKEKLLVIQECGYASDGVDKIELLKKNNSVFIIQDIRECDAKPMVENALNIGLHDYVLNQKEIVRYISFLNKNTSKDVWVEYLLYTIHKKYNYDFRLYQRDTINRRLNIFMINHELKNIKDAIGIILFNTIAFKSFFLEVSINVTELFRGAKSFETMMHFIEDKYKQSHHLKLWSAGCSSGEEISSVVIALESLKMLEKSIVYATDFNDVILEEAKHGVYGLEAISKAKVNLSLMDLAIDLDNYFFLNDQYYILNERIKKKIHYFEHNLATDTSFNEFDIIICKNVIIYFDYNLQLKVFQLFYDSLQLGGFLILGDSELLMKEFENRFKMSNESDKIYQKVV